MKLHQDVGLVHYYCNMWARHSHALPLILIVNIQFLKYHVPSRAYARKPPFNHLYSTSSESTFLCILAHNCHFSIFQWQDNKEKITQIPWVRSAPQSTHPIDIETHPISHLSTSKVSSMLRRTIPRHRAPLKECFPRVSRNHFSMRSPCYSFVIA